MNLADERCNSSREQQTEQQQQQTGEYVVDAADTMLVFGQKSIFQIQRSNRILSLRIHFEWKMLSSSQMHVESD